MQIFMNLETFVRISTIVRYNYMRFLKEALLTIWERYSHIGMIIGLILSSFMSNSLFSGIPEPGIILHGQIRDDSCTLSTTNELIWTFTPVAGGDTVTVSTKLSEIEGQEGLFTYKVLIPLEMEVPNFPVSDNTIAVSTTAVEYKRTVQVVGTNFSRTDTMSISSADRGTVKNVSIVF